VIDVAAQLLRPFSPACAIFAKGIGECVVRRVIEGLKPPFPLARIGGPDGDSISVTYKAKSALKETDLLTIAAQTSFSAHRALFANPSVTSVTVVMLADWTDQYGATSEDVTTVSESAVQTWQRGPSRRTWSAATRGEPRRTRRAPLIGHGLVTSSMPH
jgi:hypothetical protein